MLRKSLSGALMAALLVLAARTGGADEGMWTFDNLPRQILKEKYGFDVTDEWARHLQLSSVRFSTGGSGSFVSPTGLVMTNHHVGQEAVQKLADAMNVDMVGNGFLALRPDAELKCQDLEIIYLVSITDVTDRVRAALKDKTGKEAADARRSIVAELEGEESEGAKYRREVVAFYGGDQYCVYRYRSFTDCRLVFAPEKAIASFGGDRDNFCYPRWCLDMAFFRVYDEGKPAATPNYFKWSRDGAQDGDLVFVSGHPGRTGRYETAAACRFNRDVLFPLVLQRIRANLDGLYDYASQGVEQKRRALDEIASWENSLKAYSGYLEGLRLDRVMARIEQREQDLLKAAGERAELARTHLDEITRVYDHYRANAGRLLFTRLDSQLVATAKSVMEMASELAKPNDERLPQYRENALKMTELAVLSSAPIFKDMEAARVRHAIRKALEILGPDDAFVQAVLQGKTPEDVGNSLLESRLDDVEFRRELIKGGPEAIEKSTDPAIRMMRATGKLIDDIGKLRTLEISEPLAAASAKLAEVRREVLGRTGAPDANFTLRLSYGQVKGYELGTTDVPFTTTAWGLYERNRAMRGKFPYNLPVSWEKAKADLDLDTEFNFVCTTDIIGGNSGSPVLNRAGEIVGLIFDGNIQSLSNNFCYDEEVARAVSVHSSIIIESLRKVYHANSLADELVGSKMMR